MLIGIIILGVVYKTSWFQIEGQGLKDMNNVTDAPNFIFIFKTLDQQVKVVGQDCNFILGNFGLSCSCILNMQSWIPSHDGINAPKQYAFYENKSNFYAIEMLDDSKVIISKEKLEVTYQVHNSMKTNLT